MGAPTKVDGKWKHRIMVSGVRTAGTFDTKAAALAWEAERRMSKTGGGAVHQTCADAFDKYEREVSKLKKGYRWEALRLAAFARSSLGPIKMRDIDTPHIAAWRDERLKTVQGSTVQREMNLLSNVFTLARKEWKWIKNSPTTDVRRPKENKPRFRRITEEEIALICHALGWQNRAPKTKQQAIAAMFLFGIETGMRASEMCALTKDSVSGRVAFIGDSKNDEARDVPLSPRAREIWAMVPNGFGVTDASRDSMFRKAREQSGIVNLKFHDTRHEAITRLAKKLHVLDLARMVGHKDIRKLMIYYNESAHDTAEKL